LLAPSIAFGGPVGPYTGRVVDGHTGEPVQGASVLVYWEKVIPVPMARSSEIAGVKLVYTDPEGRYEIPLTLLNMGLLGVLDETHFLIYAPGYEAYMVEEDARRTKGRPDFRSSGNLVTLGRIGPNFDHRGHWESMERALWGLDANIFRDLRHEDRATTPTDSLELRMMGVVEKAEFLRRIEWEKSMTATERRP
jgi:hypothetical protein